jgi:hypothetical protein
MNNLFQGGYSPNGGISEMYGSIGHFSSNYGNLVCRVSKVPKSFV